MAEGRTATTADRSGRWPAAGRLTWLQVGYQNRLFFRTPIAAFFTLVFPWMLFVLFEAVFSGTVETSTGEITVAQFYAPSLAAFAAASATYTNIGVSLPVRRDAGILKRVRGTPLPAWIYMAGVVGSAVVVAAIAVTLMMGWGWVFYDVDIEAAKLPAAIVSFVVGVAAFAALGLALAAVAPSGTAAPAMANATLLPVAFISNVFIPFESDTPRWLTTLGDVFPLKPFAESLSDAFNPFVDAPAFDWWALGRMVLWAIGGVVVALRLFRWEPAVGGSPRGT